VGLVWQIKFPIANRDKLGDLVLCLVEKMSEHVLTFFNHTQNYITQVDRVAMGSLNFKSRPTQHRSARLPSHTNEAPPSRYVLRRSAVHDRARPCTTVPDGPRPCPAPPCNTSPNRCVKAGVWHTAVKHLAGRHHSNLRHVLAWFLGGRIRVLHQAKHKC
jgi:hypothetical protein